MAFLNRCIWTAVSAGTGDFVVSAAAQNGYTPALCLDPVVVNGATYHYFATNGTDHEEGNGAYNTATGTLARTTIRNSSTGSKISFAAAPTVYMGGPIAKDISQPASSVFYAEANETSILAAAAAANTAGGGEVVIPAGRITMTQALPAYNYVIYRGAAWGSDNRSNQTSGSGGTILVGNSGIKGFAYHETDLGVAATDYNTFVAGMLVGAGLQNLTFEGYDYGVKVGARYNPGMQSCRFDDLNFVSCVTGDFYVENYWCCEFEHIHSQASGTYSVIGRASGGAALNCGNSMWKYISININNYNTKGFCLQARDTSQLNQDNIYSPEPQCNHGTTITQAATMSNGSANITVTDSTKFPVGMPVAFSATANGFNGYTTTGTVESIYFVKTSAANVITVAKTTYGSAVSATGNTAVNVLSKGFPNLAIMGEDSGSSTTAINIYSPDFEGGASAKIVLQNSNYTNISGGYIGSNTGTDDYATYVLRGSIRAFLQNMRASVMDKDATSNATIISDTPTTSNIYAPQNFMKGLRVESGQTINFADQSYLSTPGGNAIAQINGTSPQNHYVYNTFTSSTNGEWVRLGWNGSNEAIIGTDKGSGGGSVRGIRVMVGGTNIADLGISVSGSYNFTNAIYTGGGVFANSVSPTAHGLSGMGMATNAKIYLDQTSGILFLWNATGANYGSISINGANLWGLGSSSAGSAQSTNSLQWDGSNNVILGNGSGASLAALATNATNGFAYIPTCAGTPTGVPTAFTGHAAMLYDTTNNKLYIYNGAWKGVTLT